MVDDSAKRVYHSASSIQSTFLPAVYRQCTDIAKKCKADGDTKCEAAYKCAAVYDALSKGCESAMASAWAATLLVAIEDSDGAFEELAKAVGEQAKVVKSIKGGEK